MKCPFTIYAAFEASQKEREIEEKKKPTKILSDLISSGYGVYSKSDFEEIIESKYYSYTGEKTPQKFVEKLKEIRNTIDKFKQKEMVFTLLMKKNLNELKIVIYAIKNF